MSNSILAQLLKGAILKGDLKRAEYVSAFSADCLHIVKANNREPLASALKVVPVKKDGTAVKGWASLTHAVAVAVAILDQGFPTAGKGWIGGAGRGSFDKASQEVRAPYLLAHADAVSAFDKELAKFSEWCNAVELTEDEKSTKKAEAEAKKVKKAEDQREAILKAAVVSGEYVRADSLPKALGQADANELIGALSGFELTARQSRQLKDLVAAFEVAQLEASARADRAMQANRYQRDSPRATRSVAQHGGHRGCRPS